MCSCITSFVHCLSLTGFDKHSAKCSQLKRDSLEISGVEVWAFNCLGLKRGSEVVSYSNNAEPRESSSLYADQLPFAPNSWSAHAAKQLCLLLNRRCYGDSNSASGCAAAAAPWERRGCLRMDGGGHDSAGENALLLHGEQRGNSLCR